MAIYTISNTSAVGKPCKVFDASGDEIVLCTYCDTDTGEIERIDSQEGCPVIVGNEVRHVKEQRPVPLRIVWTNGGATDGQEPCES